MPVPYPEVEMHSEIEMHSLTQKAPAPVGQHTLPTGPEAFQFNSNNQVHIR